GVRFRTEIVSYALILLDVCAMALRKRPHDGQVVSGTLRRADFLKISERPQDAGGAKIERLHRVRWPLGRTVQRMNWPQIFWIKVAVGVADNPLQSSLRVRQTPLLVDQGLMAFGFKQRHEATFMCEPRADNSRRNCIAPARPTARSRPFR